MAVRIWCILKVSVLCALSWQPAAGADLERGKALHQANCIHCHAALMGGDGTAIYTRPDRRIESLEGLRRQVERCKNSLGMPWPPDQIEDVVQYLNARFYKFNAQP